MFFIVSGFVIPYSMYQKKYQLKNFFKFLLKRTIRIEPPYIIFLFVLLIWNYCLFHTKGIGKEYLFGVKDFFMNALYLVPFFSGKWIIIIFWTLAVEFQFYMLTGLTYNLLLKNQIIRYLTILLFVIIGCIIPEKFNTVFNYYIFFAVGFISFLNYTKQIKRKEYILFLVFALGFIIYKELQVVIPILLFTLLAIEFLNFKTRISAFFGKISYSLYLTHGLAGGATVLLTIGKLNGDWQFIAALVIAVLFAWIYYLGIEQIFLKQSKKIHY
jgi:peptidoglycan/LPS O-acetylase OafA/YrhL